MADTRVVLPACPCPIRARLRRLAPSYTFTGCLLPQAYGKGDTARNEDEYRVQASPTTPAKLLMLTQGMGVAQAGSRRDGRIRPSNRAKLRYAFLVEEWTRRRPQRAALRLDGRMRPSLRENCRLQRRALLCDQLLNLLRELRRAHVFRLLFPARANVHFVRFGFFVSDHQQKRHFLHRVFADLRVHLFVARIDFHPHAGCPQLRRDFFRILRMPLGDRDHRHLHRREPYRKGSGVVFDEYAEEALDRSVEGAVDHEGLLAAAVIRDVFEIEALWQIEVELHG